MCLKSQNLVSSIYITASRTCSHLHLSERFFRVGTFFSGFASRENKAGNLFSTESFD